MKLQGRNLSIRIQGEDVKLLHTELAQLGFTIPESETRDALFGPQTEEVVKQFQTSQRLQATGVVDEPTAALINREVDKKRPIPSPSFVVKGHVRQADGWPFTEGIVRAFDKDLRSEELLGETKPDAAGFYEIRYSPEQFRRAEKNAADLVVRVFNREQLPLVSSDVIFNAAAVQVVDIVLDEQERVSEFERYIAEIRPLLEDLSPAGLNEDDIDFIAGETGIPHLYVAYLTLAHQHAQVTKIDPEAFYGLFRENLPTHLPALLMQSAAVIRLALDSAIQQNIIPARLRAEIERLLAALKRQVGERILANPDGQEIVPRLLGAAGLSQTEQETFLTAYLNHDGNIEAFWHSMQTSPLAAKVQPLQATLQMGLVTQNNLPLIQALQNKNVRSIRDIPRLERRELEQLIMESSDILAAIPPADDGETSEQKAVRTVEGILEVLNAAIPTAFVQAAYEKSAAPLRRDVARVLSNAPELELRDDHIDRFLADNPRMFEGVADPESVRMQLKGVQRALRVAPNAEHAEALMAAGLDSAQSITSLAPAAFEELFTDKFGGSMQTRAYYQKAQQVSASVMAIASAVKQSVNDIFPVVILPVPDSVKALPNFTTLFGSQSLCSCEHCGSVLSPAAYLVDLLEFLNPKSGSKPIAKLRQKRPDIEHIPLTCENTNTPLPYVDLVNEVLEFYVANGTLTATAARDTQGMSAEELSVNPQYVIDSAYQKLGDAVYPQSLPFHRPLALARLYLEHLGASRHQLMQTFRREGQPGEADIDLEFLKISAFERDILTGNSGRPLAEFYGYPAALDPSGRSEIKVSDFLGRTALTYEELIQLLATTVLNAGGSIKLEDDENPPRCDLAKTSLKNLTADFWQKAHRVIRLWRKLGWSMSELDLAFTALQEADITLGFLRKLAATQKLKADLRLPLNVLLSFWSDVDTQGSNSLYEKLFLNKAVLNPPDAAFALGTPENSGALLNNHMPAVLAALRLTADDFTALCEHLNLTQEQTPLNLTNLSALHRYTVLAWTLKLKLKEFLSLLVLTGDNPFVPADPGSTVRFAETLRLIKDSGFTVAQLNYLYRHLADAVNPIAPSAGTIIALFRSLQAGLQKVAAQNDLSSDPTVDPLKPGLIVVLGEGLVEQSLAVIYGTPPWAEAERSAFIDEHFASFLYPAEAKSLLLDPAATQDTKQKYIQEQITAHQQKGFVTQTLSDTLGLAASIVSLLQEILKSEANPTKPVLRDFLGLAKVTEKIPDEPIEGSALKATLDAIGKSVVRLHKAALLLNGFGISEKELAYLSAHSADFGGFDLNALPLNEAGFQVAQFLQWQRLAGLFAFRENLAQPEADWADVFAAAYLPQAQNPRQTAIDQLKKVTGWNPNEVDFLVGPNGFNLLSAQDFVNEIKLLPLQLCIQLCKQLGISCEQLFAWAGIEPDAALANDIISAVKAKYTDEQWLAIAKPLNDTLRESQKSALVAYLLANDTKVKQAGITDGNQLFQYFLIDVEMSACMKTSRIKQAISSVQLFIQSCLMNLEDGVSPSAIDAEQWEWMKNYRVWEANRKVFLYPENWIEPELRDDKSSFFKGLETELLQNDLTLETAEQAFVHYLEKLDQVARLEVCGLYVQEPQEWGDEEVVHVFGRTTATPHVYYYRRLLNGRTWTPWEKIEMDIEGDHLVPVVHNRRLYLFWLHFEEKQDESQQLPHAYIQSEEHWRWLNRGHPDWKNAHKDWRKDHAAWLGEKALIDGLELFEQTSGSNIADIEKMKEELREEPPEPREPEEPAFSSPPPLTHWEVQLAWSEYKGGQWSGKETSSQAVWSPHVATSLQDHFLAKEFGGALALTLFNQDHHVIPESIDGSYPETIFSVYLPTKNEHFLRTSVEAATGELKLQLFRRYSISAPVLNAPELKKVEGHDSLGWFSLQCGNKVYATLQLYRKYFESLPRPRQTENEAMSFQHLPNTSKTLTFNANGKVQHILTNLPGAGDFGLLYEHQRAQFLLKPPFQSFFFQDQSKTYFASYFDDSPTRVIKNLDQAQLAVGLQTNSPLVTSVKGQSATSSTKQGQLSGSRLQVFQSGGQSVPQALSIAEVESEPLSSSRLAQRAGFMWKSSGAKKVLDLAYNGTGSMASGPVPVAVVGPQEGLRFETFFHPHVCEFIERLYRYGIPGLLNRATQQLNNDATNQKNIFAQLYEPSALVASPYPGEHVDFGSGAYASYNWELFFHIPMLIAVSLTKNQRFEDALPWYHFIFNPTTDDTTKFRQRYWNTLPFHDNTDPEKEQIQEMLLTLAGQKPGWQQIEAQIEEWLADPFNPHLIARLRLTAYQKNVVMKYIDNLIAWADQLFSRDTIEAINEATLLYVLAYNILGPRPQTIPAHSKTEPKTYKQLEGDLDAFANTLVEAENIMPYKGNAPSLSWYSRTQKGTSTKLPKAVRQPVNVGPLGKSAVQSLYFCVPRNEELLRYWDTVEDRLFKIRHCMNIEGVARELPLFEPPIDPALLVRAKAAGVDLSSVLNDLFAPVPHYRFNVMLQKALELCNELKPLGGALLSALEKRDAETLSNLRATQETALLKAIRDVKQQQIEEAKANIEALNRTRRVTETRYNYYRDIERISAYEQNHMDSLSMAHIFNLASQSAQAAASVAFLFPNFASGTSGPFGSPVAVVAFGGSSVGGSLQAAATVVSMISAAYTHDATMASIVGGHERRWDEWKLQESLANKELDQIDKQIAAAEIRQAITEKELENHEKQIANSMAVEEFLRGKYTNEDLYSWMITQVSKVYFQAYKLAYDLAKRAERTYRHEIGVQDSGFIQFGYWDSLKNGLLAGEQLTLDLKRLDAAYLNQNKREYELTKHVSLLQVDPEALLTLRATGLCTVLLPEELFDMDGPGHYFRRIKTVAVSIPCVTGPYTSVNCTLTLLTNSIRKSPLLTDDLYARQGAEDNRFIDYLGSLQSIVASSGQNDTGLFETNLRDERYLPFENSGVISEWQLELPAEVRQFDYDTISDVILHIRYTARQGGELLRKRAEAKLKTGIEEATAAGSIRLFSVRHDFPTEWAKFKRIQLSASQFAELTLDLREEHYPFWSKGILETIHLMKFFAKTTKDTVEITDNADGTGNTDTLVQDASLGNLCVGTLTNIPTPPPTGTLTLYFNDNSMENLWLALKWGKGN